MIDQLCARLRLNNKQTTIIGLGISYSKDIGSGFYHTLKLDAPTDSNKDIFNYCIMLFDRYYEFLPIRKVSISCGGIVSKKGVQLNLFENVDNIKNAEKINNAVDEIKSKFGKNSLITASNLLPDSTAIERNTKIGGHHE